MSRYVLLLSPVILLVLILSCTKDKAFVASTDDYTLDHLISQQGGKDHFILPASNDFGMIPQDPQNPLSAEKA